MMIVQYKHKPTTNIDNSVLYGDYNVDNTNNYRKFVLILYIAYK